MSRRQGAASVLVITHGKLVWFYGQRSRGRFPGITERFGNEKLVKLQFDGADSSGRTLRSLAR